MSEALVQQVSTGIAERLSSGRITVPVLPTVASAVLALMNDPDADLGTLAGTLRNDPALAGHVMKYANSPLMRGGAPIVSLQQAIARLGMRSVAEVVLAACMGPKLFKAPAYAALIDRIWHESLATGLWAREIARSLRRNVEVSFLCGLLHQIGKPVVLQAAQEILGMPAQPLDETLLARIMEQHAVAVGLEVAQRWHLPELVSETIGGMGENAAAERARDLVATVIVARAFAGATLDAAMPDVDTLAAVPELDEINLYRADIERLLGQLDAMRATLEELAL